MALSSSGLNMRFVLLFLAVTAAAAEASDFENRYYASVFSGDLSWVSEAIPDTASGVALKARFDEHFVLGIDDASVSSLDDPLARSIVRRYFDYWREALLVPQDIESAEARLLADIARLLGTGAPVAEPDEVDRMLASTLDELGFHYRGGRTRPLIDFMLWRTTRTVELDVALTDGQHKVTVHFLDDFIVRGWSYFATFGRSGTGGWADRDALYCISAAYDIESEEFENSYLRHEARHFADYELFPGLQGPDLEYRAKLTELAFSSVAADLLDGFFRHADGASSAPHPLANWHTVHDVARTIDLSCTDDPRPCIESASNEQIQAAARRLLREHTDRLESLGASSVETTLEQVAPD